MTIPTVQQMVEASYQDSIKAWTNIPGRTNNFANSYGRNGRGATLGRGYTASVWARRCVQMIANSISSMPWKLTEQGDDEESLPSTNPTVQFINDVNERTNFNDLRRDSMSDYQVFGFSAWYKQKMGDRIIRLIRIPSAQVQRTDSSNVSIEQIRWTTSEFQTVFKREELVLFQDYGAMNPTNPDSPMRVVIDKVNAEQKIDVTTLAYFVRYGIPPHVFVSDGPVQERDNERYQSFWGQMFNDVRDRMKTLFIGGGLKPYRLMEPLREMVLPELREQTRIEVCGAFGVPSDLVGATHSANKSVLQHMIQIFNYYTIVPIANYMDGILNAELMPELFGNYKFANQPEKQIILQEDQNEKSTRLIAEANAGIITREVAAIALGYDAGDVPEEVPQRIKPGAAEITQFRNKAVRMFRQGVIETLEFRPDRLLPEYVASIIEKAKYVESEKELKELFHE